MLWLGKHSRNTQWRSEIKSDTNFNNMKTCDCYAHILNSVHTNKQENWIHVVIQMLISPLHVLIKRKTHQGFLIFPFQMCFKTIIMTTRLKFISSVRHGIICLTCWSSSYESYQSKSPHNKKPVQPPTAPDNHNTLGLLERGFLKSEYGGLIIYKYTDPF